MCLIYIYIYIVINIAIKVVKRKHFLFFIIFFKTLNFKLQKTKWESSFLAFWKMNLYINNTRILPFSTQNGATVAITMVDPSTIKYDFFPVVQSRPSRR